MTRNSNDPRSYTRLGRVTKETVGRPYCMTIEVFKDGQEVSSAFLHRAEPAVTSDHTVQVSVQVVLKTCMDGACTASLSSVRNTVL